MQFVMKVGFWGKNFVWNTPLTTKKDFIKTNLKPVNSTWLERFAREMGWNIHSCVTKWDLGKIMQSDSFIFKT